jgi:hypothetical protein
LDVKSRLVVVGVRVNSDTVSLSARSSISFVGRVSSSQASRVLTRRPWRLLSSSASQTHDPKMKIDLFGKIMLSKSVELLITIASTAPTWRANCQCLTIDSLPWGYPGQLFGLWRVLELNGERRDSRFILVRALNCDRVITLRPVGVNLCVGLLVLSCLSLQGCPQPLFISVEMAVVRLQS